MAKGTFSDATSLALDATVTFGSCSYDVSPSDFSFLLFGASRFAGDLSLQRPPDGQFASASPVAGVSPPPRLPRVRRAAHSDYHRYRLDRPGAISVRKRHLVAGREEIALGLGSPDAVNDLTGRLATARAGAL
jgi:hypothetical protein